MTSPFPELAKLLQDDEDKVRRVVGEFHRSATRDLHSLEQAAAAQEWKSMRSLAYRLHVSCLYVGGQVAADATAALGLVDARNFAGALARCRPDIVDLLDRAETYAKSR